MEEGDVSIYTSVACNSWVEIKYRPIWFIPWYRTLNVIDIKQYEDCNFTDYGVVAGDTRYQLIEINHMEHGAYNVSENTKIIMDGVEYKLNSKTYPFILSNLKHLKSLKVLDVNV